MSLVRGFHASIKLLRKIVTTFLRHGADDKRFNVHSPDGYVRVAILVQLPEFRRNNLDAKPREVIMMHAQPRIMMNAEGTKLKAIQGHTLDRLDIYQLYEKIASIAHYVHHPL